MLIEKRRGNLSKVVTSHESTLQSTDLKSYLLSLFYQVGLDEKKTGAGRKLRKERKNVSTINLRVPPLETSRSLILSLSLPLPFSSLPQRQKKVRGTKKKSAGESKKK